MTPPLPLHEAQQRLLDLVTLTEIETVSPEVALGRYLAQPFIAKRTQPSADLSAMDGFAVSGSGPWQTVGESRCGAPFGEAICVGQAVQISTGAHIPVGADAIVLIEDAAVSEDGLIASDAAESSRYTRRAGSDFVVDDILLSVGTKIGPTQLALARMAGVTEVAVRKASRIAILECGDELANDPEQCEPHQIPATNGAMVWAMAMSEHCLINRLPPAKDNLEALIAAITSAKDADLIVISGGASVGEHDLARPALQSLGARFDFWRVAIKPGKPLMVAQLGRQLILGLPGNPVSSYVTGFLFMLPAIRKMLGAAKCVPTPVSLEASADLPQSGPRRTFLRANYNGRTVTPLAKQDSGSLAALASANALIERSEHSEAVKAGTYVPTYILGNGGIA
ncbi:MAG: molybdopterin molybdotransferase MoeA [Pontixanthobacter sp.]